MAIETRQAHPHGQREPEDRTDFETALDHVRENPLIYVAGLVFTIVAVIAGVLYIATTEATRRDMATTYMAALVIEEPAERTTALVQAVDDLQGDLAAEALYMAAESAFEVGDRDQARTLYERVRAEYPASPFAAPATEGLGFLLEEDGELDAAMDLYREVQNSHAYAFEARRQWYNLARIAENQGDLETAIDYYTEQINAFPGSSVAQQAQAALERLRREQPGLFPDDFAVETPGDPAITLDGPAVGLEETPPADLLPEAVPEPAPPEGLDPGEGTPLPLELEEPAPAPVQPGEVEEQAPDTVEVEADEAGDTEDADE